MCGIAGTINVDRQLPQVVDSLAHRGPDDSGIKSIDNVCLYHTRLAIQDIQSGQQPMTRGATSISYNGEVYNHLELRHKHHLECKTNSDTETILALYEKLGMGMLDEIDGMFAFALYDSNKNTVYLARDRAGKKPLYYHQKNEQFSFSSELNCLKSINDLSINTGNISAYLHTGVFFGDQTPFHDVHEVLPGTFIAISTRNLQRTCDAWWSIESQYDSLSHTSDNYLEEVESRLRVGIKSRLLSSDLEVGAFLSGGIDSGLICAIASEYSGNKLKTFTVSFDGSFDESSLAKAVAQKYETDHQQISIGFDSLEQDIEKILLSYGEPFWDSSAIPSYYVSKEASKHLKVVLNGDGADELFGGYRRYVPYSKLELLYLSKFATTVISALNKGLPKPKHKRSTYEFIHRLLSIAGYKEPLDRYIATTGNCFTGFTSSLLQQPDNDQFLTAIEQAKNSSQQSLSKLMLLDFKAQLTGTLLPKMDIATMQHSLEARSPFLCKGLLEYAPGLPENMKVQGKTTKYLLRQLGDRYLPPNAANEPKRGFEIPLQQWVDSGLREIINSYLSPSDAYIRSMVEPGLVDKLLLNKLPVQQDKRAKMLWILFSTEVWYQGNYTQAKRNYKA